MVKWTEKQQQAIDESDSDILVAAAAGSGKTAVLVERIIQKIIQPEDPYQIDEILVATFTNAAAEEMRARIGSALEEAIADDPGSHHLKKQLSLLQRASISTLHAFCTTVVRQYAYRIDIDPAFRIADQMEMDLIRQEVVDDVLEEAYSKTGEELDRFFHVVDMFSSDRSDEPIVTLLLKLYQFSMESPWPEEWLQKVAEKYEIPEGWEQSDFFWLEYLKYSVQEDIKGFKQEIERALELARTPDGPYQYIEALESDLELVSQVESEDDWNKLQTIFRDSTFKSLSRKKTESNEETKEKVKSIRKGYQDDWKKLKEGLFKRSLEAHMEDMSILQPAIQEITALTIAFKERFTAVKKEKAIVDFSDLEHYCLAILMDEASTEEQIIPTDIAEQYKKQFKEVFVDEYQDINFVQETILSIISKQEPIGNRFMVGDVKQSIYRFRHAEPNLFIDKYQQFADDPAIGIKIDLAENFRSREDVLTGTNYIFRQILDEALGEIVYSSEAELKYGNQDYNQFPLQEKATEVIIVDRDSSSVEQAERSSEEETSEDVMNIELEARVYAQKIKELTSGNGTDEPFEVIDKATNQPRPIQYRDMVILQRSLTGVSTIIEELRKQGIPVHAELSTGYLEAIEIKVMINMLKVIDNPFQDIPLASVLRSPIVGVNEEVLAQIRLANKHGSYYDALKEYTAQGKDERLQQFMNQLEKFRHIAKTESLSDLIWYIFQETGYYDFVAGIPGGRQRQANLRALYDRARGYEETSFRGLFRFLRFIERMEEEKKDLGEARALSEQEDVVRIMTIHKSKGLEFPVVLLGGLHKQFNFQDLRATYMLDKDFGFATKFIDPEKRITYPTLYYQALKQIAQQKTLAEEMRVLYVAMTRAKEKLLMIGNVPSMEKLQEKWTSLLQHNEWTLPLPMRKKAKSYFDWIGPALIRHHQNTAWRGETDTGAFIPEEISQDTSNWHVQLLETEQLLNIQDEQIKKQEDLKEKIVGWSPSVGVDHGYFNHVNGLLSYTYPFEKATKTNAKQSVTEIKRRQEAVDEYSGQQVVQPFRAPLDSRPRFMQETTSLSAAEIGTAMHTVMQHIPFHKPFDAPELDDFIETLVVQEKLTEEEAIVIDREAILAFFETQLLTLIQQSKKVEREVPFTYSLDAAEIYPEWENNQQEKVFIQGVVDCLLQQEDGLVIIDYKTDEISEDPPSNNAVQKLKEKYETQLSLYKRAMQDILNQEVTAAYLYFFDKNLLVQL